MKVFPIFPGFKVIDDGSLVFRNGKLCYASIISFLAVVDQGPNLSWIVGRQPLEANEEPVVP